MDKMDYRRVEIECASNFDYRIQYWENGKIKHLHYTMKIDENLINNFLRYGMKP